MKKFIGYHIAKIGAFLWENGGWINGEERYEDLKVSGKLGYNLFCEGLKLMNIRPENLRLVERET